MPASSGRSRDAAALEMGALERALPSPSSSSSSKPKASSAAKSTPRKSSNLTSPSVPASASRGERSTPFTRSPAGRTPSRPAPTHEAWWSMDRVEQGVRDGTVILGELRVNAKRPTEAYVPAGDGQPDVFVDGPAARNRALHGDRVALLVLTPSSSESASSSGASKEESRVLLEMSDPAAEFRAHDNPLWGLAAQPSAAAASRPSAAEPKLVSGTGRVVAVLSPDGRSVETPSRSGSPKQFVGTFHVPEEGVPLPSHHHFVRFKPRDSRQPHLLVPRTDVPHDFTQSPSDSMMFEVELKDWGLNDAEPSGRCVRIVGQAKDLVCAAKALLVEHDVDHGEFPAAVLDSLALIEGGKWSIPPEEFSKRLDLRDTHTIFTVDPLTAKDIDDALHCRVLEDGSVEVGVHIADVSYFVAPGTPLDEEAQRRCTSVYLVGGVIPMLPAILSEEYCSLNPYVDRLAYSCIWRMHPDGTVVANRPAWYGRTVIRSCCKLDYGTAQRIIDNGPDLSDWDPERQPRNQETKVRVHEALRTLHAVAMKRRKMRHDPDLGGALSLNAVKMSFRRDDKGNPVDVTSYPMYETNNMIEEYMLLANFFVAQRLIASPGDLSSAVLRRHPPPNLKKLQEVSDRLDRSCGVTLFRSGRVSSSEIQRALLRLTKTKEGRHDLSETVLSTVVTELLKAPFRPAEYFCAGLAAPDERHHWALNIPYYTHFTSPIRRYADVCVHRALTRILEGSSSPLVEEDGETLEARLQYYTQRCNEKHEASRVAQEECDVLYLSVLLESRETPWIEEGIVTDLGQQSFDVLIPKLGLVRRVHATYDMGAQSVAFEQLDGGKGEGGKDDGGKPASGSAVVGLTLKYEHAPVLALKVLSRVTVKLVSDRKGSNWDVKLVAPTQTRIVGKSPAKGGPKSAGRAAGKR